MVCDVKHRAHGSAFVSGMLLRLTKEIGSGVKFHSVGPALNQS